MKFLIATRGSPTPQNFGGGAFLNLLLNFGNQVDLPLETKGLAGGQKKHNSSERVWIVLLSSKRRYEYYVYEIGIINGKMKISDMFTF